MSTSTQPQTASDIKAKLAPRCLQCGEPMPYYGGSAGYICHDTKILIKGDGWIDEAGEHRHDRRLNNRTIDGIRLR